MARAAGFEGLRFHDLRHTSATLALGAGFPTKTVTDRLGHTTAAFTLHQYGHVLDEMQRQAADAQEAVVPLGA